MQKDEDWISIAIPLPPAPEPPDTENDREVGSLPFPDAETVSVHPNQSENQAEIVPEPIERIPSLALPPNYKSIPIPDAPAISQALQVARSLRPLARQIAFGPPTLLDEMATVDHIAETKIWQPVLKPETELWLDVALVFDASPSMCLWQRLWTDLHRLLSRYGEFRDVRVWWLRPTTAGNINLTSRNGTVHKPSELLTGDRRRLVVIVSDCVAPAWHNGNMRSLIATWSDKLPTVVFHVFPERLWSRTALARSVKVEFQGKQPGLPSDHLQPFARSVWDRKRLHQSLREANVRLPIVPIEQSSIASWAQVVAGDRHACSLGIIWDAQSVTFSAQQQPVDPSPRALEEQIDSFLLLASPMAHQLAGLLASAPVITLPIVRLIRQAMLPHARSVHVAEVFMSGLLKVSGSQVPTFDNAERIAYELVDDMVRDRLRAGSLVVDALTVLEQVSRYVAQGLGKSVAEFRALLRTPTMGEGAVETVFLNAFATVTAKILRGLGSEFEALANSLAPSFLEPSDLGPSQFIDERPDNGAELGFPPPLETEDFTVITVQTQADDALSQSELEPFEFTVARLVKQQVGELDPTQLSSIETRDQAEWVIQRQQQRASRFTETLLGDVPLEMVAIPGGVFLMGSPEDEPDHQDDESPQHEVTVEAFFMGAYPITQSQWRVVTELLQVERELDPEPSNFKGANRPVEQISWYDAVEFCARLSVLTNRQYRLPTEAEWEYACRARTNTPFHFGETITSELANYDAGSEYNGGPEGEDRGETTSVEYFGIANAFGLSDMHGNVLEWCQDYRHQNYERCD